MVGWAARIGHAAELAGHAVLHRDELVNQLKADRAVRGEERRRTRAATVIQMQYR